MKEREYKFKIDKVKPGKLSKPEIIKSLKEFSSIKKLQPFTMREFDKWEEKPIGSQSIGQIFGSWTEAMREAGLKSTKNLKKDPVEMVEIFKDAWESYDAIPSGKQLDIYLKSKSAPYTTRVYCHTFGSIGRLVERIIKHQDGQITDSELTAIYKPKFKREKISPKLRYDVLKRDGEKCVKCGNFPFDDNNVKLEVDHILPVTRGGKNNLENLQTLCFECNNGKGDKDN